MTNRVYGIDVSEVQGQIDWRRVADAGYRFAIIKVSEGLSYLDPRRLENLTDARVSGMYVGAYHYGYPNREPLAQAHLLWQSCGEYMPNLPPVLDIETTKDKRPSEVVTWIRRYVEAAERFFGRLPIIYLYPDFAKRLGKDLEQAKELARCPLWMAHYKRVNAWEPGDNESPFVPAPWDKWTIWQFSGDHSFAVPGIRAASCPQAAEQGHGACRRIDRNVLNGNEAALRELCGLPSQDMISTAAAPPADGVPDVVIPPLDSIDGIVESVLKARDAEPDIYNRPSSYPTPFAGTKKPFN